MNVLSLFDGMSCGQIALDRLGIKPTTYFASEIDKFAIQTAKKNFPDTVHLGSVTDIYANNDGTLGPDHAKIDLLIGGSPCQGFSRAGQQKDFDDPRSKLFWHYVRLLETLQPAYFLLENVKMSKESQDIISGALGVEPIEINSALVSAQSRRRLYWTNLPITNQPADRGILLKDIVEGGALVDRDKACCLDAHYYKGGGANQLRSYIQKHKRQVVFNDGCNQVGMATDINGHDLMKRIYSVHGKSPTLNAMTGGNREPKIAVDAMHWRKLTPTECERLQTVPVGYTEGVSNTQRYKMLGNGWTVDVICHLLHPLTESLRKSA